MDSSCDRQRGQGGSWRGWAAYHNRLLALKSIVKAGHSDDLRCGKGSRGLGRIRGGNGKASQAKGNLRNLWAPTERLLSLSSTDRPSSRCIILRLAGPRNSAGKAPAKGGWGNFIGAQLALSGRDDSRSPLGYLAVPIKGRVEGKEAEKKKGHSRGTRVLKHSGKSAGAPVSQNG